MLTASYAAVGYGESQPIADNGTEDGREANRRIEFRLIRPEQADEHTTALEQVEAEQSGDADTEQSTTGTTGEDQ